MIAFPFDDLAKAMSGARRARAEADEWHRLMALPDGIRDTMIDIHLQAKKEQRERDERERDREVAIRQAAALDRYARALEGSTREGARHRRTGLE